MDNKTIFTVTLKGEGEVKGHTRHLSDEVRRALMLVDDKSTVGELAKRAAPSLRVALDDMLQELEKGGFIQDKAKAGNVLRMATPKMSTVAKKKLEEDGEELDFTTVMRAPSPEILAAETAKIKAQQEAEAKARKEAELARLKAEQEAAKAKAEAEARARAEAEAAHIKAEQEAAAAKARAEAEAARIKAEQDAARAKAEAEARAKQEAEAARLKAEQEAKARAEAEAARIKAEQEAAKAKAEEAEAARLQAEQVRAEAEAARIKAEREAAEKEAKLRQEAEAARIKAEQDAAGAKAAADAKVKLEAEEQARQSASAAKAKADAASARSMIATVLFFDVVGYTKQSVAKQIELKGQFNKLVSEFIKDIEESQRIILDTGDGAAIGFLQHPEDAIDVAVQFRNAVTANRHQDYPELKVRMGIHLGPVNVVKDMNGQNNMVGDGINDAQRIMSFAPSDHIYISRPYYDVVSRLTAEYAKLLKYRGVEKDKHGREHQVYEVMDDQAAVAGQPMVQQEKEATPFNIQLDAFALSDTSKMRAAASAQLPGEAPRSEVTEEPQIIFKEFTVEQEQSKAGSQAERAEQKPQKQTEAEARAAAELKAQQEADRIKAEEAAGVKEDAARVKAEQEASKMKEEAARKMAEEQAKVWAEAEQRAKAQAKAEEAAPQADQITPPKAVPRAAAKARRKPLPWGKIGAGLFALLLVLVALLPYVWPMQDYAAQLEKKLSAQLQQPVHIGHLKGAVLPLPKLELQGVSIGSAQELKADNAVLNFGISALFAETKAISRVEISNLTLSAESFDKTLAWMQAAVGDAHYPIAHMVLQGVHVSGEGLNLPKVRGNADMDAQGHFSRVVLNSEDGKFAVELKPQQSRWQVVLNLRESSLPALPGIIFDELNAKGEVEEGAANFNEIDGRIYGGILTTGSAKLAWQKGWQVQGHVTVKMLELQKALPQFGISGEMEGDAGFTLSGAKLPQLTKALNLDGNFVAKKGSLNNMDIVETASSGNRQGAAVGRTHFDELSGVLQADNAGLHLRQIKITAGVMSASGSVDISPDKQLSGRLNVDLKMRAGLGSVPLSLSGPADKPVLRVAR